MELRHMLSAARVELAEPRPQRPSYRHLLHLGVAVVQNRFNRLANTGRAWTVGETILTVSSGTADYTVSANGLGSLGKVLDVTTYDPTGENLEERQVPFHDLSDVAGGWNEWGQGAARIAFYRKEGSDQLWARVRPTPTDGASYRVSYSVGAWAVRADLGNSPLLEAHHHLFVAEIARDALPATEWSEDTKADEVRRANLEASLSRRIAEYGREFDRFIASLSTPRNTYREEAFSIDG